MIEFSSLSDFAKWVKARRDQLGWSQQKLADRAGVSRNYVSMIERGVAGNVSFNTILALHQALGDSPKEVQVTLYKRVWIDAEIAAEIAFLNGQGVWTEASCAGHGDYPPFAIIPPSSCARAQQLGYEPVYLGEEKGMFKIVLKSQVVSPKDEDKPVEYCPRCAVVQPIRHERITHHTVRCAECQSVIRSGDER